MSIFKRPQLYTALLVIAFAFGLINAAHPRPTYAQVFTLTPSLTETATLVPSFTSPPVTNTPQGFLPTPTAPSATPSFCLTPLDFKVGDTVVLRSGISVRAESNPNSALLANYQDRREFIIIGGPVCFGGFNFWNIQGHGIIGWVAEGRWDDYWLSLVRRAGEPLIPCFEPQELVPGERFLLAFNVRIRTEPTLVGLTQTVVPAGDRVIILDGPVCAEGYNWWKVRAVVLGVTHDGWMAEANRFGKDYILEPTPTSVCDFALNLRIGDRARVTYSDGVPKNLRTAPSTDAPILYELLDGVPLIIEGGPVCSDNYNWWQVRVLASTEVIGWMAEGGPAQRWIARNALP